MNNIMINNDSFISVNLEKKDNVNYNPSEQFKFLLQKRVLDFLATSNSISSAKEYEMMIEYEKEAFKEFLPKRFKRDITSSEGRTFKSQKAKDLYQQGYYIKIVKQSKRQMKKDSKNRRAPRIIMYTRQGYVYSSRLIP